MASDNRRIVLAARPKGKPTDSDFRLETGPVPEPGPGQALLRTLFLSLDPYMRGRMSDAKSYAAPVAVDGVMEAEVVAQVAASRVDGLNEGDIVLSRSGWQDYALTDGKGARKVDTGELPLSTALGVLGMPGMTAYTGLLTIGKPKPGETIVVAAASGPVGATVGQIGKVKGCRVVGIAGSAEKCAFVKDELGFDAAVDHRSPTFAEELADAVPDGIDVYFENVGGKVFEAVLPLLNPFARIPVCGLVAQYNATEFPGAVPVPVLMRQALSKRLHIQGFLVFDFNAQEDDFRRDVGQWVREGKIRYREDVVDGLENAPRAFQGLLEGKNFGKLVIRVADRT
ncbi:NADP-dependent oxidoreductase [Marinivivus vitaminiproducens]|uniref:NADP-dependent oxidoreductase n=1 Tax=Marinivivus vitaminiproducens TaxID=3035935 RepID=UPI0027A7F123|nr:NADP-dependent oxidoreductase [Geminicoccaceae bacterium SCSIO 64248]